MLHAPTLESKLTRVGVFYDGNYFLHVSNYYNYHHERRARINISGLHHFLKAEVARAEGKNPSHCQIIDAHYFRGRLSAQNAQTRNILYGERVFDEILMREGIVTHYLPLSTNGEKGIDVWLALEAFELAIYKRFDVSVLIAADGDYVPLIRKLNTVGTRVMVLGWDFSYTDENGKEKATKISQSLLDEVTYPLLMHTIIDDRSRRTDPLIDNLFIKQKSRDEREPFRKCSKSNLAPDEQMGKILSLKTGFGFIKPEDGTPSLFFHYTGLENVEFNELEIDDQVVYTIGENGNKPCAKNIKLCGSAK